MEDKWRIGGGDTDLVGVPLLPHAAFPAAAAVAAAVGAAAGRHTKNVGVLSPAGVRHEEPGEVGVHPVVQHLTPSGCHGVRGIAKDVQ